MKKSIKMLSAIFIAVVAIVATSCSSSDHETEKALAGTWETIIHETENGIVLSGKSIETYSLDDHKFTSKISYIISYPVVASFCTITYTGEWKASKTELTTCIDEDSIEFSFNKDLTDRSDREEFKSEILNVLEEQGFCESIEFKSAITDTFDAVDGDGQSFTYTRVN